MVRWAAALTSLSFRSIVLSQSRHTKKKDGGKETVAWLATMYLLRKGDDDDGVCGKIW